MKSVEQQLQESQAQVATLTTANKDLSTKFEEAHKAAAKATVSAEITKLLSESKLPAISQDRVRKQFAEATEVKDIAEAIKEEQDYVKQLGGGKSAPKNLGAADNGTTRESDTTDHKANLEEAFKLMPGMSDKDAKLAARL